MVAPNSTPSSSSTASWSKLIPSRRMTAMLRTFGVSVTAIMRGSPSAVKPCSIHEAAASVA